GHGHFLFECVYLAHPANVAVKNFLLIIVDRLEHLVAEAKAPAETFHFGPLTPGPLPQRGGGESFLVPSPPLRERTGGEGVRRVQHFLEAAVQIACPQLRAVHRGQHLDVLEGIETEAGGDALPDQPDHPVHNRFRTAGLDDVEIAGLVLRVRFGNLPLVYQVGGPDNAALSRLAKNLGQTDDGDSPRGDDVGQDRARPHTGELVHVTDQHQARPGGHGAKELVHQHDVHHGDLVDDKQVEIQVVVAVAFETAQCRV